MKRILSFLLIGVMLFSFTACGEKEKEKPATKTDAVKFKEEYESLNGVEYSEDSVYRTLSISETNPFVYSDAKEIVEKIENKETFYVYFGSAHCPWCRSVMEKAIQLADYNNIDKIYYVDIWGDNYEEILRDKYKLDDKNKPVLVSEGAPEYAQLLEYFDAVLDDYTLSTKNKKTIAVGEKRIYAPNFIYVENGVAVSMTDGKSKKLKNANDELTDEILKDQENLFNEFFVNEDLCNEEEQAC